MVEYSPQHKHYHPTGKTYAWYNIWMLVLTKPSVKSFRQILGDPQKGSQWELLWVFIAGIIAALTTSLRLRLYGESSPLFNFTFGNDPWFSTEIGAGTFSIDRPTFAVETYADHWLIESTGLVFSLIAASIAIQICAYFLGGKGHLGDILYAQASYEAPLTVIAAVFSLVPIVGVLVALAVNVYKVILVVIAIKAVYGLTTIWAVIVRFAPAVLLAMFLTSMVIQAIVMY